MRHGVALVIIVGCGKHGATSVDASGADDTVRDACPMPGAITIGGSRPVAVHVPPGYAPCVPAPLVIVLHGYGGSGAQAETYLKLAPQSDARGFLYVHPDGTVDQTGNRFWNATDACCNLYGSAVDDSAYLSQLITDIEQSYSVDPKRVFVVGHSNGGFMSHRMACDHADQIAAIASLAGAQYVDVSKCAPTTAVAVLEIHGTSDVVVPYNGGSFAGHAVPASPTTATDWATLDGCTTTPDTSPPPLDLDSSIPGAETTVARYAVSCRPGGAAELWTMQGGSHVPTLSATFDPDVVDFLYAHPKP
jgi:polyhydroxybutyrate depolymerase